ncbi:hypothetical protein [Umezawaea sp. Da 62-37]|uniref:hypothetical protein n=1 Tax=Umezawaea sp. Da 62-37 TaxID=3075927 RepID=UPI0028F7009A|nr:hypothetical protein [Umezawaea sp. Da 62-37]WNV88444.1 hypothetical protein RM788_09150 [Umezawaea sp. Da 62-37]
MSSQETVEKLLAVLREVPGLKAATPTIAPTSPWVPWDWDSLAVDLGSEVVEIRVVATALPLPPLLDKATVMLGEVLRQNGFEAAVLRIVVTDLDAAALHDETATTPSGA